MILLVMAYAIAVGCALGATGVMLERLLAARRWPRRAAWMLALAATVLLTIAAPWRASRAASGFSTSATLALSAGRVFGVRGVASASLEQAPWLDRVRRRLKRLDLARMDPILEITGIATSTAAAGVYAAALWTLSRRRRRWRDTRLGGVPILVAQRDGPSVVGVWTPRIVLPEWALRLEPAALDLMVTHEREHQLARDPLIIHAALLAAIAMPWNPAVWWMLARLKLAVEMDCDARVLARTSGVDETIAYGELLLTVAVRQSSHRALIAPAMLEHPSSLRRRIAAMCAARRRFAGARLAGAAGAATVLFSIALLVPAPGLRAQGGSDAKSAPSQAIGQVYEIGNGVKSPVPVRQLDPVYSRAAMQAKIQGDVHLSAVVETTGLLDQIRVIKSLDTVYGLDQAAIDAAKKWLFKPGMKDGKAVPVRVQLILEFRLDSRSAGKRQDTPGKTAYQISDTGVVAPVPITQKDPAYTDAARQARIQGEVFLTGVVGTNGHLDQIHITRSLDTVHGLDQAAIDAAKQWLFTPGQKDGTAVPVSVELNFEFKLR